MAQAKVGKRISVVDRSERFSVAADGATYPIVWKRLEIPPRFGSPVDFRFNSWDSDICEITFEDGNIYEFRGLNNNQLEMAHRINVSSLSAREQASFYRAAFANLNEVVEIDRHDHAAEIQSLKDFYFKCVLAALIVGAILGGLIILVSIYFPGSVAVPSYIR